MMVIAEAAVTMTTGIVETRDNTAAADQLRLQATKSSKHSPGGMSMAVNVVKEIRTGKKLIEKTIRLDSAPARHRARAELRALRQAMQSRSLNHLHKFYEDRSRGTVNFILEYCDKGSLDSILKEHLRQRRRVKEDFVWHVLIGMARGLAFLHCGITDAVRGRPASEWDPTFHLDLKPCNVFLSTSGQQGPYPRVVVGDFGCAITLTDIWDGMVRTLHRCETWRLTLLFRNIRITKSAVRLNGIRRKGCLRWLGMAGPDTALRP